MIEAVAWGKVEESITTRLGSLLEIEATSLSGNLSPSRSISSSSNAFADL